MRLLLLSRYSALGASSRYRSYQYLPYLRQQGLDITVSFLLDDLYIQRLYAKQPIATQPLIAAYVKRILTLLSARQYDLVWIEKEALPWFPAWFEVLLTSGVPYVVDYDDALFHRYDQHSSALVRRFLGAKIDRVMQQSALVIAGNRYLADRAFKAGAAQVEILPTVIDLERYAASSSLIDSSQFTIGWIGSPGTSRYLKDIQPALQEICRDRQTQVVAIGAGNLELENVSLIVKPWSESTEVRDLESFDVGIMPLPDAPWEKGKCGFKLIQYMACRCPVVGSPIGANQDIIEQGQTGFQAATIQDWITAFQTLKEDKALRQRLGAAGRRKVETHYSLQVTAPRLLQLLKQAVIKAPSPATRKLIS